MVPAWAAGTAKVKIEVNSIASDRAAWLNATPLLTLPLMDALPSDVTPPPDDELLPDPQAVIRKAINVEIRISEADLAIPVVFGLTNFMALSRIWLKLESMFLQYTWEIIPLQPLTEFIRLVLTILVAIEIHSKIHPFTSGMRFFIPLLQLARLFID